MDQEDYLKECFIKQRVIKNAFDYAPYVNKTCCNSEAITEISNQCQLRLYLLSQMAISLEKPKTEKKSISNTKGKPGVLSHNLQSLQLQSLDDCSIRIPYALVTIHNEQFQDRLNQIYHSFHIHHVMEQRLSLSNTNGIDTTRWKGMEKLIIPFEINYDMDDKMEVEEERVSIKVVIPTQRTTKRRKQVVKSVIHPMDFPYALFQNKCYSSNQSSKRRSSVITTQKPFYNATSFPPPSFSTIQLYLQQLASNEVVESESDPIIDDWEIPTDPIEDGSVIDDEELFHLIDMEEAIDVLDYINNQDDSSLDILPESRKRVIEVQSPNPTKRLRTISFPQDGLSSSHFNHIASISTKAITKIIREQLDKEIKFSTEDILHLLSNQHIIETGKEDSKLHSIITWILICLVHTYNVENHAVLFKMVTVDKIIHVSPFSKDD